MAWQTFVYQTLAFVPSFEMSSSLLELQTYSLLYLRLVSNPQLPDCWGVSYFYGLPSAQNLYFSYLSVLCQFSD